MNLTPFQTLTPRTDQAEFVQAQDFQQIEDTSRNLAGYVGRFLLGVDNFNPTTSPMQVVPASGQTSTTLGVQIIGQYAFLQSRIIDTLGTPETLAIANAPGTGSRIDLICAQYSQAAVATGSVRAFWDPTGTLPTQPSYNLTESAVFEVIEGTPGATPAPPTVPSGWVAIAQVMVASGTTAITASMITSLLLNVGQLIAQLAGVPSVIAGSFSSTNHATAVNYYTTSGRISYTSANHADVATIGFGLKVKSGSGAQTIGGTIFVGTVNCDSGTYTATTNHSGTEYPTDWTYTIPDDGAEHFVDFISHAGEGSSNALLHVGSWLPTNLSVFANIIPIQQSPTVVVTPSSNVSVKQGNTLQFTGTYLDGNGNQPSGTTYAWSTTAGTISAGGLLNTTGASLGTESVSVTASPASSSPVAATVLFTTVPPYTLSITPAVVALNNSGTSSLALTGALVDANGNAVAGTTFAWTLSTAGQLVASLTASTGAQSTIIGIAAATPGNYTGALTLTATTPAGAVYTVSAAIQITQYVPPPSPPQYTASVGPISEPNIVQGATIGEFGDIPFSELASIPPVPSGYSQWVVLNAWVTFSNAYASANFVAQAGVGASTVTITVVETQTWTYPTGAGNATGYALLQAQ